MKRSLPILLLVLLVAAAAAVLGVAFARKDAGTPASDGTDGGGTTGGGTSTSGGSSSSSGGFPLVQGSRGDLVRELQTRLNTQLAFIGYEPLLDVDGIFGPRTAEAARYLLGTDTVTRELYDQLLVA